MLARMGAVLDLEPRAPASKTVEALKELVNARDALIKDRIAALNRQAIAVSPLIKRQLAQRLRPIDGQIEAIDRRLKTLRNSDSDLLMPALRHLDEHSRRRRGDRKRARRRDALELGRLESTPEPPASSVWRLSPAGKRGFPSQRSIRGGRQRARQAPTCPPSTPSD